MPAFLAMLGCELRGGSGSKLVVEVPEAVMPIPTLALTAGFFAATYSVLGSSLPAPPPVPRCALAVTACGPTM